MRIKVESAPPLPHVKAWYSIHTCTRIVDLKVLLCRELQQFRDEQVRGADITLLLEDFELFDSSSIDVIRDGDLVLIQRALTRPSNKRKTEEHGTTAAAKRTKLAGTTLKPKQSAAIIVPKPSINQHTIRPRKRNTSVLSETSTSLHSDDLTSSSDSTTDSSSSSSESSSDSDSESSSESDSSVSTPSVLSTRFKPSGASVIRPKGSAGARKSGQSSSQVKPEKDAAKPAPPPVPPGLGKPTTHGRNARRRLKKMHEKIAMEAEPASVNDIPLGVQARTVAPEPTPADNAGTSSSSQTPAAAPQTFMMASLQNKNKKKGFKNALSSGVPAKISFEGSAAPSQADVQALQEAMPFSQTANHELPVTYSRLVPPSEKQENGELPPNLFVTSVDVEEGYHPKKKRQHKLLPIEDGPKSVVPLHHAQALPLQPATSYDSSSVEAKWPILDKITDRSQLSEGIKIGVKALCLSSSFTPEIMIRVGHVVKCDDCLVMEPSYPPGALDETFDQEERVADELVETYEWAEVYNGDWRIVERGKI